MKRALVLLMLATALAGCATNRPSVLPQLEGKPRVPINKQAPTPIKAATPSPVIDFQGE